MDPTVLSPKAKLVPLRSVSEEVIGLPSRSRLSTPLCPASRTPAQARGNSASSSSADPMFSFAATSTPASPAAAAAAARSRKDLLMATTSSAVGRIVPPTPKVKHHSHSKQLRELQASIDEDDPIHLALSYSLSLKPMGAGEPQGAAASSSTTSSFASPQRGAGMDEKLKMQLSYIDAHDQFLATNAAANGQSFEQKEPLGLKSPSTAGATPILAPVERFSKAVVLRPHSDSKSFLTKSSHLNPNARLEAHETAQRRKGVDVYDKSERQPLAGEDEEDMFWRDLFLAQTRPGSKYHTRQLLNASSIRSVLLDRTEGTPVVQEVEEVREVDTRTSEERMLSLVEQLRSKPATSGATSSLSPAKKMTQAQKRALAQQLLDEEADDEESIFRAFMNSIPFTKNATDASSSAPSGTAPPSMKRIMMDERGYVRSAPSTAQDASGAGGQTPATPSTTDAGAGHSYPVSDPRIASHRDDAQAASSELETVAESSAQVASAASALSPTKSADQSEDAALLKKLARLDYEYEYEPDAASFFKPKYHESKIHPAWLRKREDFKQYFGTANATTTTATTPMGARQSLGQSASTPALHRSTSSPTKQRLTPAQAALAAAHGAQQSAGALDTLRGMSSGQNGPLSAGGHASNAAAAAAAAGRASTGPRSHPSPDATTGDKSQAVKRMPASNTHSSPETATELLALHAAEKPPEKRSEKDKENIARLLAGIEYFARLPAGVRAGLAELVQLQRANRDEVLFTRIHGTRFMYVHTGAVVSSCSITGPEFTGIAHQTEEIKQRILKERAKKQRTEERRRARLKEEARRADREARGLDPDGTEPSEAEKQAAIDKARVDRALAVASYEAKKAAALARLNPTSRAALRERAELADGKVRHAHWSTVAGTEKGANDDEATGTPKEEGGGQPAELTGAREQAGTPVSATPNPNAVGPMKISVHLPQSNVASIVSSPAGTNHGAMARQRSPAPAAHHLQSPSASKSGTLAPHSKRRGSLGVGDQVHLTAGQAQAAAARTLLDTFDSKAPSTDIRGFQIGLAQASVWSPNAGKPTPASVAAAAAAASQPLGLWAPLSPNLGLSLQYQRTRTGSISFAAGEVNTNLLAAAAASAATSESVGVQGMVFQKVLPAGSLFGQNELFENTYAGIDRVIRLQAYQLRLAAVLANETKKKLSSGWVKLKTLVHCMITARDKAPMDSVIAYAPCILFTWAHKDLERLILATKEKQLSTIITSLNFFRELLFAGWNYKALLHLSSIVEIKEFGEKTVLYHQGLIEKPVWDETTHLLKSGKEVFDEAAASIKQTDAAETQPRRALLPNHLHSSRDVHAHLYNHGHNPNNHHLYLLTSGMLQLEKNCTLQRLQRWPKSIHTWEMKTTLVTRKFFGGFIRGKEIIGGETILGMDERDFTVAVPAGQTATCIVIKRSAFEHLMQKRIQHQIWQSVVRLRELASTTMNSRIQLRNHNLNYGKLDAVRTAKAASTRKVGSQSVNEYLTHILRSTMALHDDPTSKAALQSATSHMQAAEKNEEGDAQVATDESGPLSKELQLSSSKLSAEAPKFSAAFAPTIELAAHGVPTTGPKASRQMLQKIFATPTAELLQPKSALKRLEDMMAVAAEQAQAAKEEKVRQKQEKLKAASEQIIQDVVEATAGFVPTTATVKEKDAQPEETDPEELDPSAAADVDAPPSRPLLVETNHTDDAEIVVISEFGLEPSLVEEEKREDEPPSDTTIALTAMPTSGENALFTPQKARKSVSFPNLPAGPASASTHGPTRSPLPSPGRDPLRSPSISGATLSKMHAHAKGISTYINSLPIRSGHSLHSSPALGPRKMPTTPSMGAAAASMLSPGASSPYTPPMRRLVASQSATSLPNTASRPSPVASSTPAPRQTPGVTPMLRERHLAPSMASPMRSPLASSSSNKNLLSPLASPSAGTPSGRHLGFGSPFSPLGSPLPSRFSSTPATPSNVLFNVLSPLASQLPSLLSTSATPSSSPHANIAANRSFKSFARSDALDRRKTAVREDTEAAQTQARIALEGFENLREAAHAASFQAEIQTKLAAYEFRLKQVQLQKEAIYAGKVEEISRRLQESIISAHHDNPFAKDSDTSSALEVSRNQAKLKLLLQAKAEQAAQQALAKEKARAVAVTASPQASLSLATSPSSALQPSAYNFNSTTPIHHDTEITLANAGGPHVHLSAAELSSLGIPLPPPPLPIEDLSLVSTDIWHKHIRYLTDLEAEQRLIYAEYIIEKRKLDQAAEQHESVRVELLNRRYMKGVSGDVVTANESVQKDQTSKREKADEAWRLKQEFDALNESMLAMGVAGDAEAEQTLQQRLGGIQLEDPSWLNQNLHENLSISTALLQQDRAGSRPLEMDAASLLAAKIVADEQREEPIEIKQRLQMELEVTSEPPITDIIHILVGHSSDVLLGSIVGLYFPKMPPPPDIRRVYLHQQKAPGDEDDQPEKDPDESSDEEEGT